LPSRSHQAQTIFIHPPMRSPHLVVADGLLQGLPKRSDGCFDLAHEHVSVVGRLVSLRDELSRRITRVPDHQAQLSRQGHAAVEMSANALAQVHAATWTQMYTVPEKIPTKLVLSEARGARDAVCDCVVPAIPEEDRALLGAQIARSETVGVSHHASANLDSVFERDRLQASRALRFCHSSTLIRRRPPVNEAFDQTT